MVEPNQAKWVGIRPVDPEENIPVKPGVVCDINKSVDISNTTSIIHTVTTGKKFYLVAASLAVYNVAAGAQAGWLSVRDDSDVAQYDIFLISLLSNSTDSIALSFPFPQEIAAGWDITAKSDDANLLARAFIAGYEV